MALPDGRVCRAPRQAPTQVEFELRLGRPMDSQHPYEEPLSDLTRARCGDARAVNLNRFDQTKKLERQAQAAIWCS